MQKITDYSSAVRVFLKLNPDYSNKTYVGAKNLFNKTLKERVGKDEWKKKFIEHMISFYV